MLGDSNLSYKGLETGSKDSVSYAVRQDKITLILTSPLEPGGDLNRHINEHGDGVKNVALWVDDATKSWKETTSRGAKSAFEPKTLEDDNGKVVRVIHATVKLYIFVERKLIRVYAWLHCLESGLQSII